ncbi:unnamed protein product [Arabis nemorensis]|uniref:HSF-type DNA-binding domain-containing protein n=1 Tax=Arabis nemorensis TaxID=586526 RepID=A0A565C112_9BRAS|nr:unnamed protein product [Arabis nemorensis]
MDGDNNNRRYPCTRIKLREVLDDPSTDSVVSWGESGKSFIIWDESEFRRLVLPKFTIHKKMDPFLYRLKRMGFKKINSEHCEYGNDSFVRGQPDPEPEPSTEFSSSSRLEEAILALQNRKLDEAMLAFEQRREYQKRFP